MARLVKTIILLFMVVLPMSVTAQEKSVARQWNEVLLEGIRNDFARPTVHARNLWHISAAMYDAWAVFEEGASTYFLGRTVGGISIPFEGFVFDAARKEELQREAISYAAYHLMAHRFAESPGFSDTFSQMNELQSDLGYSISFDDSDYTQGSAAALGVYIAQQIKLFGYDDGANERGNYENLFYEPINEPLDLFAAGGNLMQDPDHWQPLQFGDQPVIDQSGNIIIGGIVDFLGPEWGEVIPFSLDDSDMTEHSRDGATYKVYMDPGHPPYLDTLNGLSWDDHYKWNFSLVSIWSSHLDPNDGVLWDISPGSSGNLSLDDLPIDFSNYATFYDLEGGGDPGTGYTVNPRTSQPYEEQLVPRGDFTRVLAEFWADGPDSETPPGHWFVILNYVMDQPEFTRRFEGVSEVMDPLEYDVKAYFMLGGTMHDVAIAAWSIKGYYDYVRPVSAIRYMATKGQSSDPDLPNYNAAGIPLLDGYIELIMDGDPLAGGDNENLYEIKLKAWRGHDYINDPATDEAGVGWILATEWWPYQRPSFVTPPFAGYVSGHSTYSRAAAEILTSMTGDEYFPGGLGEFEAPANEFLVFEDGPSTSLTLQWAKYYDASDQCSLSRIWGGIHPPADDLNGRMIGSEIGKKAFEHALTFFGNTIVSNEELLQDLQVFPNPASGSLTIRTIMPIDGDGIRIYDLQGREMNTKVNRVSENEFRVDLSGHAPGIFILALGNRVRIKIIVKK